MSETLLLSRQDLIGLLDPASVVEAVADGFKSYSRGSTVTPVRVHLDVPGGRGVMLVMPCAVEAPAALGTKVASVFRSNPTLGLPTVTSLYLLTDPNTGLPLAAMDGMYLTAIRTAAASAVATRALARVDCGVLGILGTGTVAGAHLRLFAELGGFELGLVCGRTTSAARAFCERFAPSIPWPLEAIESADALVSRSDVIVTATTATTPLFDGRKLPAGVHLNAVGAFTPTTREVDGATMARALVFADTRVGARAEAGDLLLAEREGAIHADHLRAELGEVLLGLKPGRTSPTDITLFESVGAAFEDAVTAELAYRRALEQGIGSRFSFA